MNKLGSPREKIMGILRLEDIIAATGGKVIYADSDDFTGVSINSRTIDKGELFIALRGRRFDGHDFLKQALDKGNGAVVNFTEAEHLKGKTMICVNDTLKALQGIARYMRLKMDIPVVGITGSNGKTTTKELVAEILGTEYRVLKNIGNLNNNIGLPMSLTKLKDDDEIIVLEMGASAPGEIKELCEIAIPNYGVLTNISHAHLEGFKDLETIRKTKLELLEYVSVAVVNADDPFMMEGVRASGFKGWLIRYGIKNPAEIRASDVKLYEKGSIFNLHNGEKKPVEVHSKISGMFNIYNILAAVSIGSLFNIDLQNIKNAVDSFTGLPMRLEVMDLNGIKVINDVYNANPVSMEEAVKELVRIRRGRTIAVLGDMLELGSYEEEAHRKLGRLLSDFKIDIFIAVGRLMGFAASEFLGNVYRVQNASDARRLFIDMCKKGDTVLIKGSRGMNMDKVTADG